MTPSTPGDNPVLVASFYDMARARDAGRTRIALMEHGAGQSYGGRGGYHGSYAGGNGRDAASLFLHPGQHPANRDRKAYPTARVEVVGSPHLDTLPRREGAPARVVAFSFHFNGPVCPETKNAYTHFFPAIAALASRYELLGHAHPLLWERGRPGDKLRDRYAKYGIEPVQDFAEVCRRADVYVCDNSSTLFAFAATGRPVVVMNAPWYDLRVNHGLRFEPSPGCPIVDGLHYCGASHVGPNVWDPNKLGDAIEIALDDSAGLRAQRERALDVVYARRSGGSQAAAEVLLDWAREPMRMAA